MAPLPVPEVKSSYFQEYRGIVFFECIEIKDRENHKNEDGRNKLEE